jgi:hypothetical protein
MFGAVIQGLELNIYDHSSETQILFGTNEEAYCLIYLSLLEGDIS